MSVKISSLELENVKRIKAVSLTPGTQGLTVIGGKNAQGKTSVIDALAWALGGDRYKPERPTREGSATPAKLNVELSNGLIVTRSGKSGSLKVYDPEGKKSGQMLLNSFIDELALNLPKFMQASDKEKAEVLLDLLGVREQLMAYDRQLEQLESERRPLQKDYLGRQKVAEDMPFYADVPEEPVSAAELIKEQQAILARNGEKQRQRDHLASLIAQAAQQDQKIGLQNERITELEAQLERAHTQMRDLVHEKQNLEEALATAKVSVEQLVDESTAELEASLAAIDETNRKVRENQKKAELQAEAETVKESWQALNDKIKEVRAQRVALLEGCELPLPELTVEDGVLKYKGAAWSEMSSAEQLRVATAIVRARKPECGFIFIDKLEQMDTDTLSEFGAWAEANDLQIIGTRVSTGDECSVIIEDGMVSGDLADVQPTAAPAATTIEEPAFQPATEFVAATPQSPFQSGVF